VGHEVNLSSEHFHAMISYCPITEGEGAGASSLAYDLFIQLTYGKYALGFSESSQATKYVPNGRVPEYVKYKQWQALNSDLHMNNMYRVFLDSVFLREGYDWNKAFSRAVCNSILFIPILSCYKVEINDDETEYAGSVGQMVGWDPVVNDRMDGFLLEIGIANALMELPQEERWLKCIIPVFVGERDENGFTRLKMNVLEMLSSDPSIKTNREVARCLHENGYKVNDEVLSRSVRDNIKLAARLQGINMSELGTERYI
jgi:hypothetical protein